MISEELFGIFNEIKAELIAIRSDITLINHDIMKAREQLDRIEHSAYASAQEPVGLAPGTPPLDFLPPEMM